jgi:hypothetical protein
MCAGRARIALHAFNGVEARALAFQVHAWATCCLTVRALDAIRRPLPVAVASQVLARKAAGFTRLRDTNEWGISNLPAGANHAWRSHDGLCASMCALHSLAQKNLFNLLVVCYSLYTAAIKYSRRTFTLSDRVLSLRYLAHGHVNRGGPKASLVDPLAWRARGAWNTGDGIRRRVAGARATHAVVQRARGFAWRAAAVS